MASPLRRQSVAGTRYHVAGSGGGADDTLAGVRPTPGALHCTDNEPR